MAGTNRQNIHRQAMRNLIKLRIIGAFSQVLLLIQLGRVFLPWKGAAAREPVYPLEVD